MKISEPRSSYIVKSREELAKADAEVKSLSSVLRGRADSLQRLTLHSPVRGIVKSLQVTTIGGVVPPNGSLMTLVPMDDQLLVEARISPRDIAFIRPDQVRTPMKSDWPGGPPPHGQPLALENWNPVAHSRGSQSTPIVERDGIPMCRVGTKLMHRLVVSQDECLRARLFPFLRCAAHDEFEIYE